MRLQHAHANIDYAINHPIQRHQASAVRATVFAQELQHLLCALLVGAALLLYTMEMVTPLYQASVTIYVNNVRSGERIDKLNFLMRVKDNYPGCHMAKIDDIVRF